MALRFTSKISSNIIHNIFRKSLNFKTRDYSQRYGVLSSTEESLLKAVKKLIRKNQLKFSNDRQTLEGLVEDGSVKGVPGSGSALFAKWGQPSVSEQQVRFYPGPDAPECKKLNQKKTFGKADCKKFDLCNCEQTKDTVCKDVYKETICKKKEAPYPSFSEACYEKPYNKPSECKLCPWRPEDNPNFKPKKKLFHTDSYLMAKDKKGVLANAWTDIPEKVVHSHYGTVTNTIIDKTITDGIVIGLTKKSGGAKKRKGPCKKFPYKPPICGYTEAEKAKQEQQKEDPCKKKPRKLIKDCPGGGPGCRTTTFESITPNAPMLLQPETSTVFIERLLSGGKKRDDDCKEIKKDSCFNKDGVANDDRSKRVDKFVCSKPSDGFGTKNCPTNFMAELLDNPMDFRKEHIRKRIVEKRAKLKLDQSKRKKIEKEQKVVEKTRDKGKSKKLKKKKTEEDCFIKPARCGGPKNQEPKCPRSLGFGTKECPTTLLEDLMGNPMSLKAKQKKWTENKSKKDSKGKKK